jgi:hypothetical protein
MAVDLFTCAGRDLERSEKYECDECIEIYGKHDNGEICPHRPQAGGIGRLVCWR